MGSKTDHDFFRGSDERQMKQFNVLVYNQSGKTSLMLKSLLMEVKIVAIWDPTLCP